ncbi:MAG: outer membrane lipoprotein-sorting protein [Desulfobacteraceae bacterium]|nr:outer membrane lipoprotein-sorting protein [Desulfobacteraceae bacterium]
MRKIIVAVFLSIFFIFSYGFAADKDVSEIVMKVEKIISLEDISADQVMTVYRKDGTIRSYEMKSLTSGKDKSFVELTAPPREKGRQVLRLGDVVWSYMPSVKRSIRVSGRGSFMGGDFENNDVLRLNLVGDYSSEIIEELPDQYVLALKGKDLSLSYAKIKLWVKKDDFQPVKQEYYTISDKLIKSTIYESIKDFNGFKRPSKLVMQSAMYPKQKTILEMKKFKIGIKNPSKRFRRSGLGK